MHRLQNSGPRTCILRIHIELIKNYVKGSDAVIPKIKTRSLTERLFFFPFHFCFLKYYLERRFFF